MRTLFLTSVLFASIHAQSEEARFGAVNLGFALSKSVAGVSYAWGPNEVNLGLKSNPVEFWARHTLVQPGLTLNRKLGPQDIYLSVTYAPIYLNLRQGAGPVEIVAREGRSNFIGEPQYWEHGWNSGELFLGLGKTFQFTHWGFHLDANLITPATPDVGQAWAYWLWAGVSYRFRLE